MGGPLRHKPRAKATFDRIPDILHRQGLAIEEIARNTATDFRTFAAELQRTRELVADCLVQVEAVKIQVAGILAMLNEEPGALQRDDV